MTRHLWMYWEDVHGSKCKPEYLKMCCESIERNSNCTVTHVSSSTLAEHCKLRAPHTNWQNLLDVAHRSDYARVLLLYNNGGVYLDWDTIVLRPLDRMFELLEQGNDFIGFDMPSYVKKSSWAKCRTMIVAVLCAKVRSVVMKHWLDRIETYLDTLFAPAEVQWEYIGAKMLKQVLRQDVGAVQYTIFNAEYSVCPFQWSKSKVFWREDDGLSNRIIACEINVSSDSSRVYPLDFIVLYNKVCPDRIKTMTRERLLQSNQLISTLLRKALSRKRSKRKTGPVAKKPKPDSCPWGPTESSWAPLPYQ